jgi:hypothetical protein
MEKCRVEGCGRDADLEVILYDFYLHGDVFFEQDFTCRYICMKHAIENEAGAEGERKPRGMVMYPYTNRGGAQGFTIYRPIES